MCWYHCSPRPKCTWGQTYKMHFAAWCFPLTQNLSPQQVQNSQWDWTSGAFTPYKHQYFLIRPLCRCLGFLEAAVYLLPGTNEEELRDLEAVLFLWRWSCAQGFCPKLCMPTPPLGQTLLGSHWTPFTSSWTIKDQRCLWSRWLQYKLMKIWASTLMWS